MIEMEAVQQTIVDNTLDNVNLNDSVKSTFQQFVQDLGESKPANVYNLIISEVEISLLKAVLKYTRGTETKAAKILGISRGTLRTRLAKYEINRRDFK